MKIDKWITSRAELVAFKKTHGLRDDWHEPDEQSIDCHVPKLDVGFDNAFCDDSEQHVVLYDEETCTTYGVNLALLFSWATGNE